MIWSEVHPGARPMIMLEFVIEDDPQFTPEQFQENITEALVEKNWIVVGEKFVFDVQAIRARRTTLEQLEAEFDINPNEM